jgi:DNA-binding NarL/FixJ family response regulator
VIADEGPPMAALLRSLIGARKRGRLAADPGPASEHLHRVMRAFRPAREQADTTSLVAPADRAANRPELEVLRLLAAGRPNQEIAAEHVVTA